jgi:hypothetical protein
VNVGYLVPRKQGAALGPLTAARRMPGVSRIAVDLVVLCRITGSPTRFRFGCETAPVW